MEEIIKKCMLLGEQKKAIVEGVLQGKERYKEVSTAIGKTITNKSNPFLLYDLINDEVKKNIDENPGLNMIVDVKKAGHHPYIVCYDTVRNIFVLVLKLPPGKDIFKPSRYRGEFASSNVDYLMEMGLEENDLPEDYEHQFSLDLGEGMQPFGIIVGYDAKKDDIYEGALRPDQQDWLYKEEINEFAQLNTETIERLNPHSPNEIELSLKTDADEEIPLKLKKS
ncbi:hypothetical protein [Alkalibacillus salilacus]|uniref:Uncharacterized protein n=1 Tax=Alkalibacillus salilacus TaxID=284582 RepID=A0ABT9VIR0_9BACI|nr:hypothetical protein [Alkalibacillus salilacus]MDQ0160730.1 hypothetical protein [Alkalibacillus salilacus]